MKSRISEKSNLKVKNKINNRIKRNKIQFVEFEDYEIYESYFKHQKSKEETNVLMRMEEENNYQMNQTFTTSQKISLYRKENSEIFQIITKHLYLGNKIITSIPKKLIKGFYNKINIENVEYEIIGVNYAVGNEILMVNKTRYEEIMKSTNEKDHQLKELYVRMTNGMNNIKFDDLSNETIIGIRIEEMNKTFRFITIHQTNENVTERKCEDEQIEVKINDNNFHECQICFEGIEDCEYYTKDKMQFHRSCYYFAYCCNCESKEDLHLIPMKGLFYCGKCFEDIKKTTFYQRLMVIGM